MSTAKKKRSHYVHPIKQKLKKIGKTMTWLARQAGCCTSTIRNFMAGRHEILPMTLRKICKVLELTQNQLYGLSQI